MKIESVKTIHFVGVKGVGQAALARVAHDMGKKITGSDSQEEFITNESLNEIGLECHNFSEENITSEIDLVIYSAAHGGQNNPEVIEAKKRGIRVLNYGQALGLFFRDKKVLAVSGTHGKTTITSMLATILNRAGIKPSWVIGTSNIPTLPSNGHWGEGEFAVIEADEYFDEPGGKAKFLHLDPFGLIVTSLDYDHPDVYKTPKDFINAFHKLIKRVDPKGILVLNGTDKNLRRITKSSKQKIRWILPNQPWHNIKLSILGQFNLSNATFAATMAHEIGIKQEVIKQALFDFKGSKRRLEMKGEKNHWLIIDDYAHHPTEVRATLQAIKDFYPDYYLTVVFQPHTFSRTQALQKEFAKSFTNANQVLIAPTFASAREKNPDQIVDLAQIISSCHKNVRSINSPAELKSYLDLNQEISKKILVTMGAGDIYKWI